MTPLLPPEPGGPSYYAVGLGEALEKQGEEVDTIAFREVRHYPSIYRHFIFLYKVLFKARKADALVILDTVSVAIPAVIAGWTLNKKMVIRTGGDFVWEHYVDRTKEKVLLSEFYEKPRALSTKEKLLLWLQKNLVLRLVDTVVYSTEWQRDIWAGPFGVPNEKAAVIENSYPEKRPLVKGGKSYLCAWRSTEFKNVDTLEEAFEKAQKRCNDVLLDIHKNLERSELRTKMRNARALVVPSLSEISPNLAMEALSMGLPVLITSSCGTKDRFGDSVTWIDPRSSDDIAEKLCDLMRVTVYEERRKAAQDFSFVRTYDDIAGEFRQICNNI